MPDEGFAAVDAMIALAILAGAVVLSLAAMRTTARLNAAAAETHRAAAELRYLMDHAPHGVGAVAGQDAAFGWHVRTEPEPETRTGQAQLCARTATARSLVSGRAFALATAEVCPA
jgi:hypothetical protein